MSRNKYCLPLCCTHRRGRRHLCHPPCVAGEGQRLQHAAVSRPLWNVHSQGNLRGTSRARALLCPDGTSQIGVESGTNASRESLGKGFGRLFFWKQPGLFLLECVQSFFFCFFFFGWPLFPCVRGSGSQGALCWLLQKHKMPSYNYFHTAPKLRQFE